MVAQSDLIAAQLPGLGVEMATPHAGAEIAGIFNLLSGHDIIDGRFKDPDRDSQKPGIICDSPVVLLIVARIHHQKFQTEVLLPVPKELLKELGHYHGILASGNTDGDLVSVLDHVILPDGPGELAPDVFLELLDQAALNFSGPVGDPVLFLHKSRELIANIGLVAVLDRIDLIAQS